MIGISLLSVVAAALATAPAAGADTTATALSFNCVAGPLPIIGGTTNVTQNLSFHTDAPATVQPGATFNTVVTTDPIVVPASQSASGVTATVNHISNISVRIPVPANATVNNVSLSGGTNLGSGTPTVGVTGGNIVMSIPGPLAGGTTVQPPTVTANVTATGAAGSTITTALLNSDQAYDLTVNVTALGSTADMATTCQPSPNTPLAVTSIVGPDTTAPTINLTAPTSGNSYALGAAVNAAYTCTDPTVAGQATSGIATCTGTVANGSPIDTSTLGTHSFSVSSTDNAGNPSTTTFDYNVIVPSGDTTPPTITITSPTNGAIYSLNQAVAAGYTCTDNIASGTCSGTVANGSNINTSSVGPKTFTVNATDGAGNPASKTVSYYVKATGSVSTGVKDLGALPSVTGSGNISGAHAYVKVTAPVANGGTIAVGDQITVDYMVYKAAPGGFVNGGPDPDNWTLNAPSNATINGNVVVDENGLNGENHASAYACTGNTGLKSLTAANPQSGAASYTISYDGRSADTCVAFKDDGVLIHTQFVATITAPGTVTVKGFAGLSGTDPTVPAGPFSTGAITDAQVGIAYTAVDATPPTINITSPVDGSVLGHNAAVNAAFTCADNVGVSSCTGQMVGGATVANGSPIDTSTGGPHQFKVTAVDAAGNTAISYVTYNVAPPTVDLSGCTVNEGATCVFTATMSYASTIPVSVQVDTSDGTAVAPGRYTAQSAVLTIPAGQTSATLSVVTKADGVQQADQTFTVTMSNPVGLYLGTAAATGTIHDTSTAPILVPQLGTVHRSSSSGTVELDIPIGLANQFGTPKASGLTITADWTTADWYSHAPADYTAASGTVTFLPGETSKMVAIQVPATAVASTLKVMLLLVSNVQNATLGGIGPGLGFGNIVDDNPFVVASIANQAVSIPAGSTNRTMKFNVTFTNTSDQLASVNFATADGTGIAGVDYKASSGTLLVPPGATTKQIWISVNGAAASGTSVNFTLTLSTPSGPITISPTAGTATGTINVT